MAVSFHDVEANGLTLHYARWSSAERNGGGSKPPLLLAHATGFCAMVWRVLAESLSDRYDVYAFDRRGHGQSAKPEPSMSGPSGYSLDFFAADTIAALDVLELRDVYAAGHSGGATELLIAAARRPDAIRRVVAIEPIIAPPAEDAANSTNAMAEQAGRRRERFASREEVVEAFGKWLPFASWLPAIFDDYVDYGFAPHAAGGVVLCCPPRIEAAQFAAGGEFPVHQVLDRISAPVLILSAETSGPQFEMMASIGTQGLLDVRRETIAGTSHFVPMEQPQVVVQRVVAFDT